MAAAATLADRIRVSDDMVGATSGLVSAMLRSKMVSKEELPGIVRDIHSVLIDISLGSVALIEQLDLIGEFPPPARPERRPVSSEAISRTVSKLLDMSTTEVEPSVPHQVRVPPSSTSRPSSGRVAPTAPVGLSPSEVPLTPQSAEAPAPGTPAVALRPAGKPGTKTKARLHLDMPGAKAKKTPAQPWSGEERRARPIKRKSVIEATLPPKLTSIEEAINLDFIVCLEDGKKVKDLSAHLAKLKMTPDEYREKWKLPAEYPMVAPAAIVKRTDKRLETYELDLVTGKIRKSR